MQQRSLAILSSILMAVTFSVQAADKPEKDGLYQHVAVIEDATHSSHGKKSHDMKAKKIRQHGKAEKKPPMDHHDHHYSKHHEEHGDQMKYKGKAYYNLHDTSHGKSYRIKHDKMYQGGKNKVTPHNIF